MYLEYDLFMKVANVSMDIVLSGISNPWNPMKKGITETDTTIQSQITNHW